MFDFISVAKKIDLDYEMKMMKDFSTTNVIRITDKILDYLADSRNRIGEIDILVKGTLYEGLNTKG